MRFITILSQGYVEGFHRQIREVTKTKEAFSSELALARLLYMAIQNLMNKWTQPDQNRSLTISQLEVFSRADCIYLWRFDIIMRSVTIDTVAGQSLAMGF